LIGRHRTQPANLFIDRGQLDDQVLKPMELGGLLCWKAEGVGNDSAALLPFTLRSRRNCE
jgi:hypothetical protein